MFNSPLVQKLNECIDHKALTEYGFDIKVVKADTDPQQLGYIGLHRCYSDKPINYDTIPAESSCGDIIIKRLLKGNRGEFSPLEHSNITFEFIGFPHSCIQQTLRSRIAVSPSVQSFRLWNEKISQYNETTDENSDAEKILYLRPPGVYPSRTGNYTYSREQRDKDLIFAVSNLKHVAKQLKENPEIPLEHLRSLILHDYRQHCILSFNTRSLMGFLDRRLKKNCQYEIQILANQMLATFQEWQPEIGAWYTSNRAYSALLAP